MCDTAKNLDWFSNYTLGFSQLLVIVTLVQDTRAWDVRAIINGLGQFAKLRNIYGFFGFHWCYPELPLTVWEFECVYTKASLNPLVH